LDFFGNLSSIKYANLLNSHRVPDDYGVFLDSKERIALGHRRLSIIDSSSFEHQPMLSEDSLKKRGLFSARAVQKLIFENENVKIDASYTLLSVLCIEIWCRSYIDN
jgi:hypothetical protein